MLLFGHCLSFSFYSLNKMLSNEGTVYCFKLKKKKKVCAFVLKLVWVIGSSPEGSYSGPLTAEIHAYTLRPSLGRSLLSLVCCKYSIIFF